MSAEKRGLYRVVSRRVKQARTRACLCPDDGREAIRYIWSIGDRCYLTSLALRLAPSLEAGADRLEGMDDVTPNPAYDVARARHEGSHKPKLVAVKKAGAMTTYQCLECFELVEVSDMEALVRH